MAPDTGRAPSWFGQPDRAQREEWIMRDLLMVLAYFVGISLPILGSGGGMWWALSRASRNADEW